MDIFDIGHWAGTDESLAAYMLSLKQLAGAEGAGIKMGQSLSSSADEEKTSRLLSMNGDVAVIRIAGPLNNTDSWMNEFMGATGYPEIRQALVEAANNPAVGGIVLDISSGGGSVHGMSDTGELIQTIDKKVKPIRAFSDSAVMSAAYWLGSSARSLDIGQVAEAGSIGVMTVHKELSKMMEDAGIKVTVMRAGEFKAAGNPYEPLSKQAKEQMQEQLDDMYKMFVEHVAEARGVTFAAAEKMAQGRVFVGQRAVQAGLVDSITTFDAVVSKVQGGIDSKNSKPKYGVTFPKGSSVKTALTEQQVAALAEAGLPVEASAAAPAAPTVPAEPVAPTASAAPTVPAEPVAPAASAAAAPSVVDFLQGQLSAANASVTDLTIKLRDTTAERDSMKASHASMRSITADSISRLRIALGHAASDVSALSDTELLAQHAALRTEFEKKFKAGGVAAVATTDGQASASPVDSPVRQARIRAVRPASK